VPAIPLEELRTIGLLSRPFNYRATHDQAAAFCVSSHGSPPQLLVSAAQWCRLAGRGRGPQRKADAKHRPARP
jgi:hypothetical protein